MIHKRIQKVIFMGRKEGASYALEHLVDRDIEVVCVVAHPDDGLKYIATKHGIQVFTSDTELYDKITSGSADFSDIDLVISYLYWKRIKSPLIKLPRRGCINFHPAPLPDYRGRAGYNTAILDGRDEFGVSAHFINSEELDTGPLIKVVRFPINSMTENAHSLEAIAQIQLLALFKNTIDLFCSSDTITTTPNKGESVSWTKERLEAMKQIDLAKDTSEEVDRKIRAFFFPPYTGATITIGSEKYSVVNKTVMQYISEKFK